MLKHNMNYLWLLEDVFKLIIFIWWKIKNQILRIFWKIAFLQTNHFWWIISAKWTCVKRRRKEKKRNV